MTQIETLVEVLTRSSEMLKRTLADFSDSDMLVRPCPGANHAAWQLGHLTNAESNMTAAGGGAPSAPKGFADKFNKQAASIDDPQAFPVKAELIDAYSNVRSATIAWVKGLKPADLDRPMPENLKRFASNVGILLTMLPVHEMMHTGQFQVIRRKLGKPILF